MLLLEMLSVLARRLGVLVPVQVSLPLLELQAGVHINAVVSRYPAWLCSLASPLLPAGLLFLFLRCVG